jgi:hypothetical protein
MKEIVDRLSREMALGVSRRKALWMFLAGAGVWGVFGGKKASASSLAPSLLCVESCALQAEAFLQLCITASEKCPRGYCAEFTLLTLNATVLTLNGSQVIRFEETCTPVRGTGPV